MVACVVVVPVLNRPRRVAPLIESFDAATTDARLLFVANSSDRTEIRALQSAGADFMVVPDALISYPSKVNAAYGVTDEPLLFLAADDVAFHPGWLDEARRKLDDPMVQVVGTNDLGNPRVIAGQHSTHTLVCRSYCDAPGATADRAHTVLHDVYRHWYCDDELVQVAQSRGVYAHAGEAIVEHLHPYHGKAKTDSTYRRGERNRSIDRRLFSERAAAWT